MRNFIMVEKELLDKGLKGHSLKLLLLMIDRVKLSEKNKWIDEENGEVYIYFTISEIEEKLGIKKRTAVNVLAKLKTAGLIRCKKQGLGKPQRIFVTCLSAHAQCNSNIAHTEDNVNPIKEKSCDSCNSAKRDVDIVSDHNNQLCNLSKTSRTSPDEKEDIHAFYVEWWENLNCRMEEECAALCGENESSKEQGNMKMPGHYRQMRISNKSNRQPYNKCKTLHFQRCKKMHPSNINYNNIKSDCNNLYNLSYLSGGSDGYIGNTYKTIRNTFLSNIEYKTIAGAVASEEMLCTLADMVAETLTERKKQLHVAGANRSYEEVYDRLMSLNSSHIEYFSECVNRLTAPIRNPRAYMITCLFNAPVTIDAYYELQARIDMNRQTAGIV